MDLVEDEKKPFDAEAPNQEDDHQPDPNESLMLDQGHGRAWLVKIPKHLMERWTAVQAQDMHLATVRVYNDVPASNGKPPKILLFLPPNQDPRTGVTPPITTDPLRPQFETTTSFEVNGYEPDIFEMEMVTETVQNQYIVAEKPKPPPPASAGPLAAAAFNTRARETILTGRIRHECNLRPGFNEKYRKQMRERRRIADTPARTVKRIEDAGVSGGRGGINRLSSGVGIHSGNAFNDLVKTKAKHSKGEFQRMARMPRNQLLDLLFRLFREQPRWGIKVLRERTQQPEQYLRETLSEVATLHRHGEFSGNWELKENFKGDGVKGENVPGSSYLIGTKLETMEELDMEEDDEEDEDDDMEEIS